MAPATNSPYLKKRKKDLDQIDLLAEEAKNELPEFEEGGETDEAQFAGTLKPVEIEEEAPAHIESLRQAKRQFDEENERPGNTYLKQFKPGRQETLSNMYKDRKQQYAYDQAAQTIMDNNEYSGDADEYMQSLSPTRRKILKNSSVWDERSKSYPAMIEQAIVGGASGMGGPNFKNPNYTQEEAKESIAPLQLVEGVGGYAAKPVQGLLNKLEVTDYKNSKDDRYTIEQALKGKKNDAGLIADMATDLTNLVGAGVGKQFTKLVDNGSIKAASKLIDDVISNKHAAEAGRKAFRAKRLVKNQAKKAKSQVEKAATPYSNKYVDQLERLKDDADNLYKRDSRKVVDEQKKKEGNRNELVRKKTRARSKIQHRASNIDFKLPDRIANEPVSGDDILKEYDEIDFYHGSKAKFDKPVVDKPYTGEGVQALGPGLYGSDVKGIVNDMYAMPYGYHMKAVPNKGKKKLRIIDQDSNKPLTEELTEKDNEKLRKFIDDVVNKHEEGGSENSFDGAQWVKDHFNHNELRAPDLLRGFEATGDGQKLLRFMRDELGIDGTRYKPGQLGGMSPNTGGYNYTFFDEDQISSEIANDINPEVHWKQRRDIDEMKDPAYYVREYNKSNNKLHKMRQNMYDKTNLRERTEESLNKELEKRRRRNKEMERYGLDPEVSLSRQDHRTTNFEDRMDYKSRRHNKKMKGIFGGGAASLLGTVGYGEYIQEDNKKEKKEDKKKKKDDNEKKYGGTVDNELDSIAEEVKQEIV